MTTEEMDLVAPGNNLERLKYAMIHNHIDFVANGSVQKLLKKKFYSGPIALNNFDGANLFKRMLYVAFLVFLTPVWLFLYLVFPASDTPTGKFVKSWIEMPFMRFVVNCTIYVLVVCVFVQSSIRYEIFPLDKWPVLAGEVKCALEFLDSGNFDCVENNIAYTEEQKESFRELTPYLMYLLNSGAELFSDTLTNSTLRYTSDAFTIMWIFGNTYTEFVTIWTDGFLDYTSDWVNCLNILLNFCLISTTGLRYSFILVRGYQARELFGEEVYHPLQVSDALRSVGLLLLFYRLYKMLRVTQIIGKQQVLLAEAFKASLSLLIRFIFLTMSFSVAANGLLSGTYRSYIQSCIKQPDGSYISRVDLTIPCPTNLVESSLNELTRYQSYFSVYVTFFYGLFDARAYIIEIFPSYENAQEWTATLLYSGFVFASVLIRLNLMTSFVILSIMSAASRNEVQFKFSRAQVMYIYILGSDPLPSPFNLIPSVNRVTAWLQTRREPKNKMLTESELLKVPKIRNLIFSAKLSYLREARLSALREELSTGDVREFEDRIHKQFNTVNNGMLSVERRTRAYIDKTPGSSRLLPPEVTNQFTKKFNMVKKRREKSAVNQAATSKFKFFFK